MSEPTNAYEWWQQYSPQAIGAMRAADEAVHVSTRSIDDTEAVAVARIEAAGRLAAALILADGVARPVVED